MEQVLSVVRLIPILTTLLSAGFLAILIRHGQQSGRPAYLLWWTIGVLCYGLGTLTEAWVGVFGWSEGAFKSWYILGALLGGFPLAQGSVYLMFSHRTATRMMTAVVLVIAVATVLVIVSPVDYSLVEANRLTGKVLVWKQVRLITPFVNIYAFVFLVGGAVYSAWQYYSRNNTNRYRGNVLIALGALLPGIGGSFTKFGYTEVLYVTELLGIILIYSGYSLIRQDTRPSIYEPQQSIVTK
jgi:hypothetical protein